VPTVKRISRPTGTRDIGDRVAKLCYRRRRSCLPPTGVSQIEHLGSAHAAAEVELLKAAGRRRARVHGRDGRDGMFRDLVAARIIEPARKPQPAGVGERRGYPGAVPDGEPRLPVYAGDSRVRWPG
jgi:hypothetical protein